MRKPAADRVVLGLVEKIQRANRSKLEGILAVVETVI